MTRWNVVVSAFAVLAFACQGARGPSGDAAGSFSLDQSSCRYDGAATLPTGRLNFTLTSEGGAADFDLWLLNDGRTFEELADHIDEERERSHAGQPPLGHPDFATLASEGSTDDAGTGTLTASLEPGIYGMACIRFEPAPDDLGGGLWPAGPVVVES